MQYFIVSKIFKYHNFKKNSIEKNNVKKAYFEFPRVRELNL